MDREASKNNDQYRATYQATRDAIRSLLQGTFLKAILILIGIFGVGVVWVAATAFTNGSATQATFFGGLFGTAVALFAGYELYHL